VSSHCSQLTICLLFISATPSCDLATDCDPSHGRTNQWYTIVIETLANCLPHHDFSSSLFLFVYSRPYLPVPLNFTLPLESLRPRRSPVALNDLLLLNQWQHIAKCIDRRYIYAWQLFLLCIEWITNYSDVWSNIRLLQIDLVA